MGLLHFEIDRDGRSALVWCNKHQRLRWFPRFLACKCRLCLQAIFAIVTCKYQSVLLSHCASITVRLGYFTMFRLRRRTAAFATVLLAPGLLLPAAAQNVQRVAAANGPDYSRCDRLRESNPLGATRCRIEVLNGHTAAADARGAAADARGAAADRRSAKADDVSRCSLELVKLAKDPKKQALGMKLLGERPLEVYGPCRLLAELTSH